MNEEFIRHILWWEWIKLYDTYGMTFNEYHEMMLELLQNENISNQTLTQH